MNKNFFHFTILICFFAVVLVFSAYGFDEETRKSTWPVLFEGASVEELTQENTTLIFSHFSPQN